jgi:hypothetical protein
MGDQHERIGPDIAAKSFTGSYDVFVIAGNTASMVTDVRNSV